MINCEMIRRHAGALAGMPFAANFIGLRSLDSAYTYWMRLDDVKAVSEAFVLNPGQWWRKLWFVPIRAKHTTMVVILNDRYIIHGLDIIRFFLEMRLAREDNNDFKVM